MIELEIVQGEPPRLERFPLPSLTIGRGGDNHFALSSTTVSRRHAELSSHAQGLRVRNLSGQGLIANGQLVDSEAELGPDALLQLGQTLLRVRWRSDQTSPKPTGERSPAASQAHQTVPDARATSRGGVVPASATRATQVRMTQAPMTQAPMTQAPMTQAPMTPIPQSQATQVTVPTLDAARRLLLHQRLIDQFDLHDARLAQLSREERRAHASQLLDRLLPVVLAEGPQRGSSPVGLDERALEQLKKTLLDEALGLGPLEDLIADDSITEIMVVSKDLVYAERKGKLEEMDCTFSSDAALLAVIERIVTPLGRRIDEASPMVDARLHDGSRINAVIAPLALKGPTLTIRKFPKRSLNLSDLVGFGALTPSMAKFLERCVIGGRNMVISGGTGSGKTTLLNALSSFIPEEERVVTIEDAAELRLHQKHVVSLETRPPNVEGKGAVTIRDLVRNALRMRPDRIVVGECRGGEALDMLQAMNTGHDGSLTTAHANTPQEMISRLETLVLMAGMDLPLRAVRTQIASAVHLIVQIRRFEDGSRKVTHITEVLGLNDDGGVQLEDIFAFHPSGRGAGGSVQGSHLFSGYLPSFLEELVTLGIVPEGDYL